MKKLIAIFITISLCLIIGFGCSSKDNNPIASNSTLEQSKEEGDELKIIIPDDGIVKIYTDDLRAYLTTSFDESYTLVKGAIPGTDAQQSYISFTGKYCKHFVVRVSRSSDFKEYFDRDVYPYQGETDYSVNLRTLIPGEKYYIKVFDYKDESFCSDVYSFTAESLTVRTLNVFDETNKGPRNVRDSGGYTTDSGKKIRYEMLYRGTYLNARTGQKDSWMMTDFARNIFKNELKIKTEIDLRTSGVDDILTGDTNKTPQTENMIDKSLPYFKCTMNQYDRVFTDKVTRESIKEIFGLLADEKNYPVYIHCNYGADRTGSIYMLIHGLLGVGYEDATRDFEMTSYSAIASKRLRDDCQQNDSSNYVAWGNYYKQLMTYTQDGSLRSATEKFLSSLGVTAEQMETVRNILLY